MVEFACLPPDPGVLEDPLLPALVPDDVIVGLAVVCDKEDVVEGVALADPAAVVVLLELPLEFVLLVDTVPSNATTSVTGVTAPLSPSAF